MSIADGLGRAEDGSVLYPYGTSRDTFWPPKPDPSKYIDTRTLNLKAIERSFWYNYDTGYITVSFIQSPELNVHVRVFRKLKLQKERYDFIHLIKSALDKRGVEVDDEELRILINDEYGHIKSDAETEIIEYQHYNAGIKIGHAVRDLIKNDLPKKDLFPLWDSVVGPRKLDIFPYNFGCRSVIKNWLGMPVKENKDGNYIIIKEKGIENMSRDELRAHLKARGEPYEKGALSHEKLIEKLKIGFNKERDNRRIHWFCCANDKCRELSTCISYDPDENGDEIIKVGDTFISSWDQSQGRVPRFISKVYAHLREKHWDLMIKTGYGQILHPLPKNVKQIDNLKKLKEEKAFQLSQDIPIYSVPGEGELSFTITEEEIAKMIVPAGVIKLLAEDLEEIAEDKESDNDPSKFKKGSLFVSRISCFDLKNVEIIGKNDPYVKVELKKWEASTGVVDGGGSNAVFDFLDFNTVVTKDDVNYEVLKVSVYDKNDLRNDVCIGSGQVTLKDLLSFIDMELSCDLINKKGKKSGRVTLLCKLSSRVKERESKNENKMDESLKEEK